MRGLGIFTVLLLAAGAFVATVVGVRSIPDVQRYLRMRQM